MSAHFMADAHVSNSLPAVANAFAATVYSDVIKMEEFNKIVFLRFSGVGTTGTSTITVEACDNTTPSNVSAVAFHYRRISVADTHAAITAATTAGFTTTAGSNEMYLVEVDADALAADGNGYEYVRLKLVEVADDDVLGGIIAIQLQPRYSSAVDRTQIT